MFVGGLRSWNVLEQETLFKTWLNDMENSNNSDWVTQPVENRLIKLNLPIIRHVILYNLQTKAWVNNLVLISVIILVSSDYKNIREKESIALVTA